MHTLRRSLAGTVILVLLGGLTGGVLAQTADEESAVWVTGTIQCARAQGGTSVEDGPVSLDHFPGACYAKLSDPRVSGGWRGDAQGVCFDLAGEPCMIFGTAEIMGPDGTWAGSMGSVNDATLTAVPTWFILEGGGAYEGWTFVFFTPDQLDSSAETSGILYKGPPAPWAETLPLAPAE